MGGPGRSSVFSRKSKKLHETGGGGGGGKTPEMKLGQASGAGSESSSFS